LQNPASAPQALIALPGKQFPAASMQPSQALPLHAPAWQLSPSRQAEHAAPDLPHAVG
jgi:hypothetical protein